jgi:hypothetical protein
MVGFICAVMGAVVVGFAAYHAALVATNTTTNESSKWREAEWCHAEAARARADDVAAEAARALKAGDADTPDEARAAAEAAVPPVPPVPRNAYCEPRVLDNVRDALFPASVYGRSPAWLAWFQPALPPRSDDDDGDDGQPPTTTTAAMTPPPPPPEQPPPPPAAAARRR